ncbi:MAG: glycine cleavage system protein GcvH [Armatimonadetes bacterium]|nr:glycine cleavage system protein GcvH [Armatimonadota bacterium]MDW8122104.1 glycine cleavage system protein GcvH [Armatimonadota bacterium]
MDLTFPENLFYTPTHEWGRQDGDILIVGITDFAQSELGDVTYLELPPVGKWVEAGQPFGVIESIKADADLYAPVSGTVVRINESLATSPEKVNLDPYGEGWIIAIRMDQPDQLRSLMTAQAYRTMLKEKGQL